MRLAQARPKSENMWNLESAGVEVVRLSSCPERAHCFLVEGTQRRLWLASERGLDVFDVAQLAQGADTKVDR